VSIFGPHRAKNLSRDPDVKAFASACAQLLLQHHSLVPE
jgi:hypothetical protein